MKNGRPRVFSDPQWTPESTAIPSTDHAYSSINNDDHIRDDPENPGVYMAIDYLQRGLTSKDSPPGGAGYPKRVDLGEFYSGTVFGEDPDKDYTMVYPEGSRGSTVLFSGYLLFFFRWLQLLGLYRWGENSKIGKVYGFIALGVLFSSAVATTYSSLVYYNKQGDGLDAIISSFRTIASYGTMCSSYIFGWWYLRYPHLASELSSLTEKDIYIVNKVIIVNFWALVVLLFATVLVLTLSACVGSSSSPLYQSPWSAAAEIIGIVFGASGYVAIVNIFVIVLTISRIHIKRYRVYALRTILTAASVLSGVMAEEEGGGGGGGPSAAASTDRKTSRRNTNSLQPPPLDHHHHHHPHHRDRTVSFGRSSSNNSATLCLPADTSILLAIQNRLHMLLLLRYRNLCRRLRRIRGTWRVWLSGTLAVSTIFGLAVALALYQTVFGSRTQVPNSYTIGMWGLFSIVMPVFLLYHIARVNEEDSKIHRTFTEFSLDLDLTLLEGKGGSSRDTEHIMFQDRVNFLQIFTPQLRKGLRDDMTNIADGISVLGHRLSMWHIKVGATTLGLVMLPAAIELLFTLNTNP